MRTKIEEITMPALAMRGLVVFPNIVMHFDVSREKSEAALKAALEDNKLIFLTAQKDNSVETPEINDLYRVGVVAEIRQTLKGADNVTRVLVEGKYRAKLIDIVQSEPYLISTIKAFPEVKRVRTDDVEIEAVCRSVKQTFFQYSKLMPKMPKELVDAVMEEKNPFRVFEAVVFNIPLSVEDRALLLEESHIISRLGMLFAMISREVEVLDIERHIHERVREQIDSSQREYYLREQMKAIAYQLGDSSGGEYMDEQDDELASYRERITALSLAETHTKQLMKEVDRLSKMSSSSQDAYVIRNYLDTVLGLPWNNSTKDNVKLKSVEKVLNEDHYGLTKVKERILENIAVRCMNVDLKGQIICLVGPPGVGKTSIARSIAKAVGRNYQRISLGGVRDESDIRGHRKTYVGAMPGRIINALQMAGSNNPLFLLDEIDKLSKDMRGDPSSALLEVLDSEQNVSFRDHYLEVPFDLSNVLFITTANTTQTIDAPLLDRMDVIEITSYTREEKFHIAKKHLVKKQSQKHGLSSANLKINDGALYAIIDGYTKEAGVRTLERRVAQICRKAAKIIVSEEESVVKVTAKNLDSFLGARKYLDDDISGKNEIGVVNGLAWTSVGGVTMPLEVAVFDGKGTIETTGSLGDVMKESARIAVSYVRSVADKYGISPDFYKEKDIHIHAPEGATPKDGPSAGVTMTTALVSALANIPVRHDVAMTGEITLHGKVLPIGGLREKTMAAYKAGMTTVVIPAANKSDLEEVESVVKEKVKFVFVEKITDVLDVALEKTAPKYIKPKKSADSENRGAVNS